MSEDREAFEELARRITPETPYTLVHYLYLPKKEDALSVGALLRAKGFRVEGRLGADGINWLVLARHDVIPSLELIDAMRMSMEQLVAPSSGEYDGWEADLTTKPLKA